MVIIVGIVCLIIAFIISGLNLIHAINVNNDLAKNAWINCMAWIFVALMWAYDCAGEKAKNKMLIERLKNQSAVEQTKK